jgi:hypothetical protein
MVHCSSSTVPPNQRYVTVLHLLQTTFLQNRSASPNKSKRKKKTKEKKRKAATHLPRILIATDDDRSFVAPEVENLGVLVFQVFEQVVFHSNVQKRIMDCCSAKYGLAWDGKTHRGKYLNTLRIFGGAAATTPFMIADFFARFFSKTPAGGRAGW